VTLAIDLQPFRCQRDVARSLPRNSWAQTAQSPGRNRNNFSRTDGEISVIRRDGSSFDVVSEQMHRRGCRI
jgi:hypothetical protein